MRGDFTCKRMMRIDGIYLIGSTHFIRLEIFEIFLMYSIEVST